MNGTRRSPFWTLAAVFVVAIFLNYPWELAQSALFEGMSSFRKMLWHCFVASLSDGALVLLIWAAGWVVLGRPDWFRPPGPLGYAVMLGAGLAIALGVEWVAVHVLQRWSYRPEMPLLPGLDVGLVPVAQMLLLPPIIFRLAAVLACRDASRGSPHSRRPIAWLFRDKPE